MGYTFSLFLMAVGAILRYAVDIDTNNDFDFQAIGGILILFGLLGLIISFATHLLWHDRDVYDERPTNVVDDDPLRPVRRRRWYRRY